MIQQIITLLGITTGITTLFTIAIIFIDFKWGYGKDCEVVSKHGCNTIR